MVPQGFYLSPGAVTLVPLELSLGPQWTGLAYRSILPSAFSFSINVSTITRLRLLGADGYGIAPRVLPLSSSTQSNSPSGVAAAVQSQSVHDGCDRTRHSC